MSQTISQPAAPAETARSLHEICELVTDRLKRLSCDDGCGKSLMNERPGSSGRRRSRRGQHDRITRAPGRHRTGGLAALVARGGQLLVAFVDRCPGQRFLVSRLR